MQASLDELARMRDMVSAGRLPAARDGPAAQIRELAPGNAGSRRCARHAAPPAPAPRQSRPPRPRPMPAAVGPRQPPRSPRRVAGRFAPADAGRPRVRRRGIAYRALRRRFGVESRV